MKPVDPAWDAPFRPLELHAGQCLIDATPSRIRLVALCRSGLSLNAIAEGAGVNKEVVRRLSAGQSRVTVTIARRILRFDPATAPELLVSSLGVSRRLQALMANGWDSAALAVPLGVSDKQVREWRRRASPKVRNHVHLAVAELYRRIGDRRGPNDMARGRARSLGFAAPIHWDDDGDLDNPRGQPKGFQKRFTSTPPSRKAA